MPIQIEYSLDEAAILNSIDTYPGTIEALGEEIGMSGRNILNIKKSLPKMKAENLLKLFAVRGIDPSKVIIGTSIKRRP